jgi:hypothetical protein
MTSVTLSIRNFGATPAWIVDYRAKVIVLDDGRDGPAKKPDYRSEFDRLGDEAKDLVIPPGEKIRRRQFFEGHILNEEEYNKLKGLTLSSSSELSNTLGMGEANSTVAFSALCRSKGRLRSGEPVGRYWIPNEGPRTYCYHRRESRARRMNLPDPA